VLAFPTAWTSYEYALSVISPHGTAGSLAYTKKFLPYARMAIMRAVESGFALARSEQQGLVTVADHCGRVAAEARSPAVGEILLVAEVSPGPGHTFYGMTGDWFARLNIVLLGSAAVFLRSSRGRPVGI
jgi:apolipoprotein N-acyltransferase